MVASTTTTATDAREAHEAALALTRRARTVAYIESIEPAAEPPAALDPAWTYTIIHVGGGREPGEMTVHSDAPACTARVGLGQGAWVASRTPSILLELADALAPAVSGETRVGPWQVRDMVAGGHRVIEAGNFYLAVYDRVREPVTDALRRAAAELRVLQEGEHR